MLHVSVVGVEGFDVDSVVNVAHVDGATRGGQFAACCSRSVGWHHNNNSSRMSRRSRRALVGGGGLPALIPETDETHDGADDDHRRTAPAPSHAKRPRAPEDNVMAVVESMAHGGMPSSSRAGLVVENAAVSEATVGGQKPPIRFRSPFSRSTADDGSERHNRDDVLAMAPIHHVGSTAIPLRFVPEVGDNDHTVGDVEEAPSNGLTSSHHVRQTATQQLRGDAEEVEGHDRHAASTAANFSSLDRVLAATAVSPRGGSEGVGHSFLLPHLRFLSSFSSTSISKTGEGGANHHGRGGDNGAPHGESAVRTGRDDDRHRSAVPSPALAKRDGELSAVAVGGGNRRDVPARPGESGASVISAAASHTSSVASASFGGREGAKQLYRRLCEQGDEYFPAGWSSKLLARPALDPPPQNGGGEPSALGNDSTQHAGHCLSKRKQSGGGEQLRERCVWVIDHINRRAYETAIGAALGGSGGESHGSSDEATVVDRVVLRKIRRDLCRGVAVVRAVALITRGDRSDDDDDD